jgi:hypothetical protein
MCLSLKGLYSPSTFEFLIWKRRREKRGGKKNKSDRVGKKEIGDKKKL